MLGSVWATTTTIRHRTPTTVPVSTSFIVITGFVEAGDSNTLVNVV